MADESKDKDEKKIEATLVSQLDSKKPMYTLIGKAPKIETGADRLYRLVNEKKKIKLPEAAKQLGVKEEVVAEWGDILEDHKMIEMHYPMRGKPILGVLKPKHVKGKKGERGEEKKEKVHKPKVPLRKRFTKKVLFIYFEIIVLGELLIYIFFVNRYLAMNFMPTVRFHSSGFINYLRNLPALLMSGRFSDLILQPLYLAFLLILIIVIILIIVLVVRSRKPKFHMEHKHKEEKDRHREDEHNKHKEDKKKEEKRKKEEHERKEEEKKKKEKHEHRGNFADIVERYKKRLKEME